MTSRVLLVAMCGVLLPACKVPPAICPSGAELHEDVDQRAAAAAFLPLACASKQVTRIDPDAVTDLSGRWNDTDSRLVANALIEQSMIDPWIRRFNEANGGDMPTVIVGTFRNESMEHIPTGTFVRDVDKKAFIEAARIGVKANRDRIDSDEKNAVADLRSKGMEAS